MDLDYTPFETDNTSLARTTSSALKLPTTGTFSAAPCTFNTALANAEVTHSTCLTNDVDRLGIGHALTHAKVTSRTSPFPTNRLQTRHRARPVGARLKE